MLYVLPFVSLLFLMLYPYSFICCYSLICSSVCYFSNMGPPDFWSERLLKDHSHSQLVSNKQLVHCSLRNCPKDFLDFFCMKAVHHKISKLKRRFFRKYSQSVIIGIKCYKIVFFDFLRELLQGLFFIFHIIVEGNSAYHLRQIAIFRKFFKGD